jgi:CHAD domain-containing protein
VKTLHQVFTSHIKKMNAYLTPAKNGEEDAIHDLRVEYKKLRALLRLCQSASRKLNIPNAVKDLYASAGRVRELQLQMQNILQETDASTLPGYMAVSGNQLNFSVADLKEKAAIDVKDVFSRIEKKLPKKINAKESAGFLQKKIKKLSSIVQIRNKKDEDLHDARKTVKDILYTTHQLELMQVKTSFSADEYKLIHELSDELGKFQDRCSALSMLRLSMFRNLPDEEKKILRQVRVKWMALKQDERKNLVKKLPATTALLPYNKNVQNPAPAL